MPRSTVRNLRGREPSSAPLTAKANSDHDHLHQQHDAPPITAAWHAFKGAAVFITRSPGALLSQGVGHPQS